MTNETLLPQLVEKAHEDPEILAVLLFGSTARGQVTSPSDIDLCLILGPSIPPDRMSQTRLRYLSEFDLDIQIFQQLPLYIRRRVLKEGRVLLSKDDDALYKLALRTVQAVEDFTHIYQEYLEAVQNAGP